MGYIRKIVLMPRNNQYALNVAEEKVLINIFALLLSKNQHALNAVLLVAVIRKLAPKPKQKLAALVEQLRVDFIENIVHFIALCIVNIVGVNQGFLLLSTTKTTLNINPRKFT